MNKKAKAALQELQALREDTPKTRELCLTDTAVSEQCRSFSCRFNITGDLAYYDPVKALRMLVNANSLVESDKEIALRISRKNCVLDYVEDQITYTEEQIAAILGYKKGKIDRLLHRAIKEMSNL